MSGRASPVPPGCLSLALFGGLLVLLPFFLANAMLAALSRLGLGPDTALLAAAAIFLGGAVNLPVRRIPREEVVEVPRVGLFGIGGWSRRLVVRRSHMVLAVNVGGCLVPAGLALYQVVRLAGQGGGALGAVAVATAVNVAICWRMARPVEGMGIALPALVPALAAAAAALLLAPEGAAPPVAFTAGVMGPLVGADLLHLEEIKELGSGTASIGGAGTFDGIVLSGLVATLLA
jgi:uncharacterized membrane protein